MLRNVSVRLKSASADKHITAEVTALTYRTSVPGGYEQATVEFKAKLEDWLDLDENDRLYVYDKRTGKVRFDGYTDQVTAIRGASGQRFTVTALGGRSLMRDRAKKLMYLDRVRDFWFQEKLLPQVPGASVESSSPIPTGTEAGTAGLYVQFPSGTALVTDSEAGFRYTGFEGSMMVPGTLDISTIGGSTAGAWYIYGDVTAGTPDEIDTATNSTTAQQATWYADPTAGGAPAVDEWAYDTAAIGLSYRWTAGAATIADDVTWCAFYPPRILGQRLAVDAVRVDMSVQPTTYLYAHHIIADLIGRMMPFIDPTNAEIATNTYQIDQATFADGITPAGIFDWLNLFEPDYFHEVMESNDAGLYRFTWRAWDDANPRYAVSNAKGFVRPGGEVTTCNEMEVFYTDEHGVRQPVTVTASVPALDSPHTGPARTRQAQPITLADGIASAANAAQIGATLLAQANRGTQAGSLVVDSEIFDQWTGLKILPGEILPGYSIVVNETGETHRLTAVDVDEFNGTATLTLDDPMRTQEQLVAAAVGKRGQTFAKASR
jgi:hypothetical protein